MTARVFVDTNVLVYARDASERSKQPLASSWLEALWERRIGRLSYQVVNEYYVTVTRKLRPGLPPDVAKADIRDLLAWHPIAIDAEMVEDAWWLEQRFAIGYWDAQIVAAARVAGLSACSRAIRALWGSCARASRRCWSFIRTAESNANVASVAV